MRGRVAVPKRSTAWDRVCALRVAWSMTPPGALRRWAVWPNSAAVADTYKAAIANDWEKAQELHYGVHPLVDLLFVETNPAPAKWLMAERGLISSGMVRSPLIPLTEAGKAKVRELADSAADFLTPINI